MKTKFGLAALDAIQKNYKIILERLIKGYERVTGKQPEGLDLTMIKREAYEKAEDSAKVVDMEGKTLDPSKPIMGGKQMIEEDVVVSKGPRPFGDNIRDAYKKAGRSREEASEMIEALDSPGAKKSYEIMEEALGVRLYGDETFEELMKIKETGVHPRGEPPIKKAEGGIIGEVQNLINAGLKSGSDLVSGAGRFILGAASRVPGLGLLAAGLNRFTQPTIDRGVGSLFIDSSGETVDDLGRLTSGVMQGYNTNFDLAKTAGQRIANIRNRKFNPNSPLALQKIAQLEQFQRDFEEAQKQRAKQLARQNVITYGSDGPGPGETTSGTFGASVNDASTFSDYS